MNSWDFSPYCKFRGIILTSKSDRSFADQRFKFPCIHPWIKHSYLLCLQRNKSPQYFLILAHFILDSPLYEFEMNSYNFQSSSASEFQRNTIFAAYFVSWMAFWTAKNDKFQYWYSYCINIEIIYSFWAKWTCSISSGYFFRIHD